jgi:WD40 repeat protein
MAFSGGAAWLAVGSGDGTVSVWETKTWSLAAAPACGELAVEAVDISSGGAIVVSATSDGMIRLWRRERVRYNPRFLPGASAPPRENAAAARPALTC